MNFNTSIPLDEQARKVAAKFLEAVLNEDAVAFWELLDRQGRGYFLGLWSYALPNISLTTIISLSGEPGFLKDTLGSIINNLKENIVRGGTDVPGEVVFDDEIHARVNAGAGSGEARSDENDAGVRPEYIPLVMELVPVNKSNPVTNDSQKDYSFISWKIDTLKCLRFYSETSLA